MQYVKTFVRKVFADVDESPTPVGVITAVLLPRGCEVTQSEHERMMGSNPGAFSRSGDRSERVSGSDTSRFPVGQSERPRPIWHPCQSVPEPAISWPPTRRDTRLRHVLIKYVRGGVEPKPSRDS